MNKVPVSGAFDALLVLTVTVSGEKNPCLL